MDTTEGNIGKGLSNSGFSPLRYGIEKKIGAIVDTWVIVDIGKEDIVGSNGPLFVVQCRESF
jgi:hypothetical protein